METGIDERTAPATQKNQDHDGGEATGDDALPHYTADRAAHKDRLIRQGRYAQLWRQRLRNDWRHGSDSGNHIQGGNIAVLQHAHQAGALAIYAHNIGLRREPVAHMGDIVDVNNCAVHTFDRKIIQALDLSARYWWPAGTRKSPLSCSRRENEILGGDGVYYVGGGKSSGLQRLHIQIHLHLSLLAAVRVGTFSPLDGGKLCADEIQPVVV